MIRSRVKTQNWRHVSIRHKLMNAHVFVFSVLDVFNIINATIETINYRIDQTWTQYCMTEVTRTVFIELSLVTKLMILALVIYMTELISKTPLHTIWKHALEQMEKQENPSLLNLDGLGTRYDSSEGIERYNRASRKNADLIILNILNNLTENNSH